MATRKQTEEAYFKIRRHMEQVFDSIMEADRKKIIKDPPNDKYTEDSPYHAFHQLDDRIDRAFEKPIAEAVMLDLRKRARGR
jgi:hypothetical protein